MATLLYLPSSSTAPTISPAVDAGWANTSGSLDRIRASTTKGSTVRAATTGVTGSNTNYVIRQYITPPLSGNQTVSGYFYAATFGTTSATGGFLTMGVRVIQSNGTTVRGTAMTAANNGSEGGFTATGRTDGYNLYTLTSVSALDGDYIVIEFGCKMGASSSTVTEYFGEDQSTNYAYTAYETVTNKNSTVQFDTTFTFGSWPGGTPSGTNQLMLQGVGT